MMRRRPLDPDRDYPAMADAQRESWEINFPGEVFVESIFRSSVLAAARRGEVFVYEEDGETVGWLWLDLARPRAGVHIRHVQVVRELWGKGYGRRLLEDAMAIAKARGARALTLNVTKSNTRAMDLYESLGFEIEEDNGPRQFMRLELDADEEDSL